MRTVTVLFENDDVRVRHVRCTTPAGGCGTIEWPEANTIVFPETGLFVKHLGRHARVVADAAHALFFVPGRPYRVSHPAPGGDDCIVLEFRSDAHHAVMSDGNGDPGFPPNVAVRGAVVRLATRTALRRRLLRHRLARRVASALEVEETVAALVRETIGSDDGLTGRRTAARASARHEDIARETQLTVASNATARWTLAMLARRVECTPFHLARVFRRVVGLPIHQYQMRARLVMALDQVLDTDRGFSEIGVSLGFTHHSHFSHAFRRAFGLSPNVLRRTASANDRRCLSTFLTAPESPAV